MIFICLLSVLSLCFVASSLVVMSWGCSLVVERTGSSACRVSSCDSWALKHSLSSCGTQEWLLHGMWDPPQLGSNPCLLHWQADALPLSHQGSPIHAYDKDYST